MEDVAHNVRFTTFARWTLSRCGFASNDRMVSFLTRILKVKTFEEMRIPLGVTATDFNTGEGVVFQSGFDHRSGARQLRVSGNVFAGGDSRALPCGRHVSHPVPTRPLREMGADRVLAVHLKGTWANGGAAAASV